jgi:hypothetical protein
MAGDIREITINARRARFMADHWEDEQGLPNLDVSFEVGCVRRKIEGLMEMQPEFRAKLAALHEEVATKVFWEYLARSMVGTQIEACGMTIKELKYYSTLKPLWGLEEHEPRPMMEPPIPSSSTSAPTRSRRRRKWNPVGCLGAVFRFFFKSIVRLVLVGWLVWYAVKLWSPPAGDAPAPEAAKPKPAAQASKVVAGPVAKKPETKAPQAGGRRIVLEKPVAIYRFDENKRPVVAGHAPAGTVVTVTGKLNAKAVRVVCELPDGRKAQGMARMADLQPRTEAAK